MRICINGEYRDMTEEEVAEKDREDREWEEEQKKKPPTDSEVLSILLGGDAE